MLLVIIWKKKQDTYTKFRDRTNKKKFLILYRVLKFYTRHAMIVEKSYELISFKQRKGLEKYITSNTQKRKLAKNDFERGFYKYLLMLLLAKWWKMFTID